MKPYDFQVLIEKMKAAGLDVAEQGARAALVASLDWLTESIKNSPSLLDNLLLLVLPEAKAAALKEIDKIDGKVSV